METLPCGCMMGTSEAADGSGVFLYEPCSLTCEYYLYVVQESARQGKPLTTLDLR